ncbi:hypothetical protein SVIOM74S_08422 [Streptomyces violarus]
MKAGGETAPAATAHATPSLRTSRPVRAGPPRPSPPPESQLGKPYVYGATGMSSYDCSGLTSRAYAAAGVQIPRTSEAQTGAGTKIYSVSQLKVGDLVFFFNDLHHVGLYAGNGQITHAPRTGTVVRYGSMDAIGGPFMFGGRLTSARRTRPASGVSKIRTPCPPFGRIAPTSTEPTPRQ